ncbi:tRNA pseudouridine synthase A [Paraconexibacter sp. AEG42_29]|uniref:tRNA pseudouridine synthase A n=1 Tax=Paraconexibacter sp. AEG42_29 TaxID=2997339 RepID=A0AAU7AS33_9ACTN
MTARLDIEYDGGDFYGWGVQPGLRTVQGELERALGVIGRRRVVLTVAGRTDRGVHATGQVASHPGDPIPAYQVNAILPPDVRVLSSTATADGFDARRHALARAYEYRILTRRAASALGHRHQLHLSRPLDEDALAACADVLAGTHDFTAFTPTETDHVRFRRDIHRAAWTRDGDLLQFAVEGDAFMRNMVRALVGTMLDVGRGKRSVESFATLLEGAPRSAAGMTAPPHGLTLVGVRYPEPPRPGSGGASTVG